MLLDLVVYILLGFVILKLHGKWCNSMLEKAIKYDKEAT